MQECEESVEIESEMRRVIECRMWGVECDPKVKVENGREEVSDVGRRDGSGISSCARLGCALPALASLNDTGAL